MATVKIVLRKKRNQDGSYPLAIRITKDRKSSFIHLGQHLRESEWDDVRQKVRKSHPNSQRLNNFLIKKLSEATDKVLELETQQTDVSSHAAKQRIKPSTGNSFFAQAQLYLENLRKSGKYNRYTADKPRIKHFREFLKGNDIAFSDVSVSLLQRFQAYLKVSCKVGERTVVNHLIVIRSVFSQAIKENVIDKKYYPFGKDMIRIKFPDSLKIGLSAEEVKRLEEIQLPDAATNHARNLWLISFYFAGMRASDVLRSRWSDFQNDRLHYVMGKNSKGDSLKVPEKALRILSHYEKQRRNKNDLVFPDLKSVADFEDAFLVQKKIAHIVSRIDKCLRNKVAPLIRIDKPLTMHIARHTFGNISGEKIPIQMLQKLYRHSSILTTIGYQANFIHKDADDALDAVIGL